MSRPHRHAPQRACAQALEPRCLLSTVTLTPEVDDAVDVSRSGATVQIRVNGTLTQSVAAADFTSLTIDPGGIGGQGLDQVRLDLPGRTVAFHALGGGADRLNLNVAAGAAALGAADAFAQLAVAPGAALTLGPGAAVTADSVQVDGTYTQTGGSLIAADRFNAGNGAGHHATLIVAAGSLSVAQASWGGNGGGRADVVQSGGVVGFGTFFLGDYTDDTSTMLQSGGSFAATSFYLGYWGHATWRMTAGASLSSPGQHLGNWGYASFTNAGGANSGGIEIGNWGGHGLYTQTAGSTLATAGLGWWNGNGTIELAGGTWTGGLCLGGWSDANPAWGSGAVGTVHQTGGTLDATAVGLTLGYTGGRGVYRLAGGTLKAPGICFGYSQWGVAEGPAEFDQTAGRQILTAPSAHHVNSDGGQYPAPLLAIYRLGGGVLHTTRADAQQAERIELTKGVWTAGSLDAMSEIPDQTAVAGVPLSVSTAFTNTYDDPEYEESLIDWGDGTIGPLSVGGAPPADLNAAATHAYAAPGLYHAVLKVIDLNGGLAYAAFDVIVTMARPQGLPSSIATPGQLNLSWIDDSRHSTSTTLSRSTDGVHFTPLAALGADINHYLVSGLLPDQTYWFNVVSDYTYDIEGGTVSGSITDPITYAYSFAQTATTQALTVRKTSDSSWSESGSFATMNDGITTQGTYSASDPSTATTEDLALTAVLDDGNWVWSGSDVQTFADPGSWSYSATTPYHRAIDGGVVTGTSTVAGSGHWSADATSTMALVDGEWTLVSGTAHAAGDETDGITFSGGGSYSGFGDDYTFEGSVSENGDNETTSQYQLTSTVANGVWVNTGTASGTWNDTGHGSDQGQGSFADTIAGGSIGGDVNANTGESWTANGSWGTTLGVDGTWTLTSGSGTSTDHLQGTESTNAQGQSTVTVTDNGSTHSINATLNVSDDQSYDDYATVQAHVDNGHWVQTGTSTNRTDDSGQSTWNAQDNYQFEGWISGNGRADENQGWSSSITTTATLHADGTVTTEGTGTSDDSNQINFSFSSNGSRNSGYIAPPASYTGQDTYSDSGSQHFDGTLHTDWVLDPSGDWRAANAHRSDHGQTQGQYAYHSQGDYNPGDGGQTKSYYNANEHGAYTFDRDVTVATAASGQRSVSGSGSGGGTAKGIYSLLSTAKTGSGYETGTTIRDDYDYQGTWSEDYATGVANATANNDLTGYRQVLYKQNGTLVGQDSSTYQYSSTSPGCYDVQSADVSIGYSTFGTAGTPYFGRTIPSATMQGPSRIAVPHGQWSAGPISTPQSVRNWQIGLAIVGGVSLAAAGGVALWGAAELGTFGVGIGPSTLGPSQVTFSVNGVWFGAYPAGDTMYVLTALPTEIGAQWASLTGIPILFPGAAAEGGTAYYCYTAAIHALLRGFGFPW